MSGRGKQPRCERCGAYAYVCHCDGVAPRVERPPCEECPLEAADGDTLCKLCREVHTAQAEFHKEWVLEPVPDDAGDLEALDLFCDGCMSDESIWVAGRGTTQCAGCGGEMCVRKPRNSL